MTLGGRVAELIKFGKITTGAVDDLNKVTKIIYAQLTQFGMSEAIGNVSYKQKEQELAIEKPYSETTARLIDSEAKRIVTEAFERTKELLTERKEDLEKVAQLLLQREVILREDLETLMGPRPWPETSLTFNQ
jgi:AFG3 family protein